MQNLFKISLVALRSPLNYYSFSNSIKNVQLHSEVKESIYSVLKSAAKCKQQLLNDQATFQQLGFDSLDGVEIIVAIEEKLGMDLQDEQVAQLKTIDDIINAFYETAYEKLKQEGINVD